MKAKSLLLVPPAILLVALVVVLTTHDREGGKPAHASEGPGRDAQPPTAPVRDYGWHELVEEFNSGAISGQIDESSAFGRLLKDLEAKDAPQLMAARSALAAAEIPDELRSRLDSIIMGQLVRMDPEFALDAADDLKDTSGETALLLLSGFRDWAMKSPSRAESWLDRRIAEGAFGHEAGGRLAPARLHFEREMIRALLVFQPDRAAARLEALPEKDRPMALRGTDSPQTRIAYATLVRRHLSPADQKDEFVRMASAARYHEGDTGVETLLRQIQATQAEREEILGRTTGEGDTAPASSDD